MSSKLIYNRTFKRNWSTIHT